MAKKSISERLIFKIFWGNMPPDPLQENTETAIQIFILYLSTWLRYIQKSYFKSGWKQWQMNHEYRMKFLNESWIIEVKQNRNHEYPKSNDSASTPELELNFNKLNSGIIWQCRYFTIYKK